MSLILLAAMAVIVALSFAPESEAAAAAVRKSTASRDVRVGAATRKRASSTRSAAARR